MRRLWLVAVALGVVAVGSLLLAAILVKRSESFSLGVAPAAPVAEIQPDSTVCQGPIAVPAAFDRVALTLGTFMRPGQALDIRVRDAGSAKTLASGRLPRGYADNSEQQVRVGHVGRGRSIRVCFTNRGSRRVVAYGDPGQAHAPSTVTIDGSPRDVDASIRFLYDQPRSLLSLAPRMIERATLFAPSWLSPWMLWSLFALVALAVPGLLIYALMRCERSPADRPATEQQASAPVEA